MQQTPFNHLDPILGERDTAALASSEGGASAASGHLTLDHYRILIEHLQAGVFVIQGNRFLFVNPKLTQLFGYSREEMIDKVDPISLTAPECRHLVRQQVQERVAGVQGRAYEIDCVRKDGSRFCAQVWGIRIEIDGGVADLVTMHDVSEIKQASQVAQQRAQLLKNAEELARIGCAEIDVATGTMNLSEGMFSIFGAEPEEGAVTRDWFLSRVPDNERLFVDAISEGVSPGEMSEFQHRIVYADGSLRTVLHRGLAEADPSGRVIRAVMILQDVTVQHAAEQRLDLLANSDEVTGLPNRTATVDLLDRLIRQAHRADDQMAVLGIEIDQLKLVSESFGYSVGDELLLAVGDRLKAAVMPNDMLAHFGGGEFVLVLGREGSTDEAAAKSVASALVEMLSPPFVVGGNEVKVSCAVGISLFPSHAEQPEKLLHHAQAAMYNAQNLGKNQICIFSEDMQSKAVARLGMEAGLRRALSHGEFELYYLPKLDLGHGAVIGVEALLHWNAPDPSWVSRSEYIQVAEETGLILPIGEWILRTACSQVLAWQSAGLGALRVGVNLTSRQLQQPDIVGRIQSILLETGLDACFLGLEITEGVLAGRSAHVSRVLGELKAMGIEISLDDFGTGHSNLSYLRSLPIDVIKVDRSFVHDVTAAPQDVSITRAIITMAHSLQMKVLAEGVETEGQLALLIANHCDQMQGHYFSPAIDVAETEAMLRAKRQLPDRLLLRRTQQRTLLLVDDEDSIVASLKRLMRRDGYRIVTANSGPQGLQRLAEESIDVIVSDQRMPGMTGVEFLRRAKALYPETVRIVLSGYTELQSITDAINEGAIYKFLTKPWDDERLRGHVAEAFSHKEMADENRRLGGAVILANRELSEVNQRLEALLSTQRERINREAGSLTAAREILDNIPAAVLGIDLEGMIAFVNADAELLFGADTMVLGRNAEDVLPPELRQVWRSADGHYHDVVQFGRRCQVVCRAIGNGIQSRGKLMVLMPHGGA